MIEIVQEGNPVLRQKADLIPQGDIQTPKIQDIIKDMKKALDSQDDGVAIAAPQIGVPLRIFIVSKRTFMLDSFNRPIDLTRKEKASLKDLVFINPEITKLSKSAEWMSEGCLSVRWKYGKVRRSTNANIKAYDETGTEFTRGAGGLLAQIFQHETDHLNGALFIDTAIEVEDTPPEDEHT